jgi:hypothetical protein
MLEKFHFTSQAGVEIVVTRMDQIPSGLVRKNRKLEPMDLLYTLLEEVADEATLKKVDALPMKEQNDFFIGWQEEIAPGESGGSST